ncbi:MAG TPA: M56 family metallopeptidase [Nitrospirota bacterium]
MTMSSFYNSYAGMYIVQSLSHSFITVLLVDAALQAWKIENPVTRQRFRLLVIILPILLFPLYQAVNPARSSLSFRLTALFDSARWLNLELWQGIHAGALFLLLLSFTTFVFVVQEMVPIIKHALASKKSGSHGEKPDGDSSVMKALAALPGPIPDALIIPDDDLVLFVTTGRHPTVFLSTAAVKELTEEEIQAAIAHEIAHIERNKRPLLIAAFLLRIMQFFNPISLMEFRRIVQEEEKICDDIAVALTGKSQALADTLRKFHPPEDDEQAEQQAAAVRLSDRLEEFSHALVIQSRIERLEAPRMPGRDGNRFAFVLTCAAILFINYTVV